LATKKTDTRASGDKSDKNDKPAKRGEGKAPARKAARTSAASASRPRIRASHAAPEGAPRPKRAAAKKTAKTTAPARKAPAAPKRVSKRSLPPQPPPEPSNAAREVALALASAGLEKKALGIEIIDVTGRVDYADFLVLMTGRSDRHVHAIATGIEDELRKKKLRPLSVEGLTAANWVILDYGDAVVHVFQEEARELYDIEGLWSDARRVPMPLEGAAKAAPAARP